MSGSAPTFATPADIRTGLASGAALLDVRTPDEIAAGTLDGALHADVNDAGFDAAARALDASRTYYVYCRSGARSEKATQHLRGLGVDAHNAGGFDGLVREGFDVAGG